jgi:hypothetical protein
MTGRARAYSTDASPTVLLTASGIRPDWTDCQRQPVSSRACTDPAVWARVLFHESPAWVRSALSIRDRAVALLGLQPTTRDNFPVLAQNEEEVLVGSDDRHLDFRAAVRCADGAVDVITFVQIHNELGRFYLAPVRLVHALMVRKMLQSAAGHLDPPVGS